MKKEWAAGCAFAFGMGAASFSLGADGEFSAGAGINYSTGKYGASTETKILSIPFTARYATDLWSLKLTVPYLRVTSPNNVIPGVGRFDTTGRPRRRAAGTTTASGIGDTVASATYTAYYDEDAERGLDLTGRIKLPTAEADKGLGTGSTDESVQLDNVLNAGIGASNKLSATDSVGASLDGRQRVTPGGAPQRELTVFWNHRTDGATRMQAYFLVGLAKGSPDKGLGLSVLRAF